MRKRTIIWQRTVTQAIILLVMVFIILVLIRWIYNLYGAYTLSADRHESARAQYQASVARKEYLEERNRLLHTTTGQRDFLVERQAMISEGERVLVLVEDNRLNMDDEDAEEVQEKTPWWQWW